MAHNEQENWDAPYGEHFDLGLVKLPAVPSSNFTKVGFLFINPGGPGGSAAKLVGKLALGILPAEALFSSFDIIGLDPRGVGLSSQVQCNMSIYAERVTLFPETDEEYEALVDKNKRLGESFRELTGPLLEHLDTISTAKDHEAHSQSEATNLLIETSSYELVLTHFFEWAAMNESSALQGQNDIQGLWTSLLDNATETPIPALSCNGTHCRSDVNAEEMVFNVQSYLAFEVDRGFGASWELLASAIYNASQGDASALSTSFSNFEFFSFLGIGCLDWKRSDTAVSMVQAKREMTNTYAPLVRGASSIIRPKKLDVKTNATVLMTASTADPSTGLPWAVGILEEIENSLPLGRETSEVIIEYLVTGQTPEKRSTTS
ncbi:hypothetical protein EJ02DRAFT_505139 [Clathrospora elynae]|uniref:AB hydrolase-1 domain-containing protein n=1 Tax=Clathrospora elynae TaxID=706981 RepID=A0A6A5SE16_9PLEO|nr:hypothetical protein EJ02DRAFT_505139 [Clathrospora elynae]